MKLIYCPDCHDVVNLYSKERFCVCGNSSGRYITEIHAEIKGKAIPLGIAISSFIKAVNERPYYGRGKEFTAFVIPHQCINVKKKS